MATFNSRGPKSRPAQMFPIWVPTLTMHTTGLVFFLFSFLFDSRIFFLHLFFILHFLVRICNTYLMKSHLTNNEFHFCSFSQYSESLYWIFITLISALTLEKLRQIDWHNIHQNRSICLVSIELQWNTHTNISWQIPFHYFCAEQSGKKIKTLAL